MAHRRQLNRLSVGNAELSSSSANDLSLDVGFHTARDDDDDDDDDCDEPAAASCWPEALQQDAPTKFTVGADNDGDGEHDSAAAE